MFVLEIRHDDTYLADKEGTDYRYEKWFKNYSAIEASGMRCVKILDTYELTYSTRPDARVKGINMLRLPELYYIITEYYLSLENQDEAVKYFDKVLQSRGLTGYADRQGATLTLEKVIQERRKELICEGQYFFTQKRYNQVFTSLRAVNFIRLLMTFMYSRFRKMKPNTDIN